MVPHLPKSPEKKVGFEAFKEACKKVVSGLETIAGILLNVHVLLISHLDWKALRRKRASERE